MLRSGSGSSTGRGAATSSIENVRYSLLGAALRDDLFCGALSRLVEIDDRRSVQAAPRVAAPHSARRPRGGSTRPARSRAAVRATGAGRSRISGSGSSGRRAEARRPARAAAESRTGRTRRSVSLAARRAGPHLPAQRVAASTCTTIETANAVRATAGTARGRRRAANAPGSIEGWTASSSSRIGFAVQCRPL